MNISKALRTGKVRRNREKVFKWKYSASRSWATMPLRNCICPCWDITTMIFFRCRKFRVAGRSSINFLQTFILNPVWAACLSFFDDQERRLVINIKSSWVCTTFIPAERGVAGLLEITIATGHGRKHGWRIGISAIVSELDDMLFCRCVIFPAHTARTRWQKRIDRAYSKDRQQRNSRADH